MTFDLGLIISNTISGILINLPWFILIIWGIKTIAKEMPQWLKILHENQIKELVLQRAVGTSK